MVSSLQFMKAPLSTISITYIEMFASVEFYKLYISDNTWFIQITSRNLPVNLAMVQGMN